MYICSVFSLKHIGAYFLLLVYSVSFGHQIIPHHHHQNSEYHNPDLVGTHDHCVAEEETHNHVAHEDHFDEGIFDYLACVLGSHEHNSPTDCELIEVSNDQKNNGKTSNKAADFGIDHASLYGDILQSQTPTRILSLCIANKDPLAENKAKRGPPQI
ncbi:MAG: hypothetical protein ACI8ZM_000039 [Crocinitomix sp.]|jgi:hypothetical protein